MCPEFFHLCIYLFLLFHPKTLFMYHFFIQYLFSNTFELNKYYIDKNFLDTKLALEKLKNKLKLQEEDSENNSPNDCSMLSISNTDYVSSTPINSKTSPSLFVRLSDIRHSNGSRTDTTQTESPAPSIPSKLRELIESDYFNNFSLSKNGVLRQQSLASINNKDFNSDEYSNRSQCNKLDTEINNKEIRLGYSADNSSDASISIKQQQKHNYKKFTANNNNLNTNFPNQKNEKKDNSDQDDSQPSEENIVDTSHTDASKEISKHRDSDFCPNDSNITPGCDSSCTENTSKGLNKNKSSSFESVIPFNVKDLDVPSSKVNPDKQQKLNKKGKPLPISKQYFCPYCHEFVTKFARHLEKHNDIANIKKALSYPLKSKRRKDAITDIRNEGSLLHNTDETLNSGILLTSRRCQSGYSYKPEDYAPCPKCKGYY